MTFAPEQLLDRNFDMIKPKLDQLSVRYRVVRERGLITADYDPERLTITINEDSKIVDCWNG